MDADGDFDLELKRIMDRREQETLYFNIYGRIEVHEWLMKDVVRVKAFREAILHNESFKNKTVLDVGCGMGMLSIFAAKAGAKKVLAVDAASITDFAERIAKDNGYGGVITVIRGKVEDIELSSDIDKVDIIVCDWIGDICAGQVAIRRRSHLSGHGAALSGGHPGKGPGSRLLARCPRLRPVGHSSSLRVQGGAGARDRRPGDEQGVPGQIAGPLHGAAAVRQLSLLLRTEGHAKRVGSCPGGILRCGIQQDGAKDQLQHIALCSVDPLESDGLLSGDPTPRERG
ncbi:uncharacterized protein Art2 isoform X2 [Drosophila takahashii]|uniref:uncharacterized protein Art2 isoform X2 n=1 Tax=Drosophila takahashii TaxID=29030 RepID=UPI00389936BA